jgi:hypothetical protein
MKRSKAYGCGKGLGISEICPPGMNARRRRLNPTDFLKVKIPVPSIGIQQELEAIRLHQKQISSINADAESNAVLASLLNKLLSQ